MSNPVLAAIAERRSIRAYKDQNVTREQIDTLLKAAQESPSANNAQPWHFSVVQNNPALLKEISAETSKAFKKDLGDVFHGAKDAIFISCDPESRFALFDCGIATQTIALAAHAIGLGTVILGLPGMAFSGDRGDEFRRTLKFPQGRDFAIAIAVGVPAGTKEAHPISPDRVVFVE